MAYQISSEEIIQHHFHTGLSRILLEQVQQAESLLVAYRPAAHREIIENLRDCTFRVHAVLKLLQVFAGETFSQEEKGFRQLNVALSQQHEDSEVVRALSKLKYLSPEADSAAQFEHFKKRYLSEKDSQANIALQRRRLVDKALLLLLNAQRAFQLSVPEIYDIDMFVEIISQSHQEVVRAYNNCVQFGGDDDFHLLHNNIKVLKYQVEILQNFAFAPTNIKRNYLQRLCSKLDLYNDLTTLICRLANWRGSYLSKEKFDAFATMAQTQKNILSVELLQLCGKILTMNFASNDSNRPSYALH